MPVKTEKKIEEYYHDEVRGTIFKETTTTILNSWNSGFSVNDISNDIQIRYYYNKRLNDFAVEHILHNDRGPAVDNTSGSGYYQFKQWNQDNKLHNLTGEQTIQLNNYDSSNILYDCQKFWTNDERNTINSSWIDRAALPSIMKHDKSNRITQLSWYHKYKKYANCRVSINYNDYNVNEEWLFNGMLYYICVPYVDNIIEKDGKYYPVSEMDEFLQLTNIDPLNMTNEDALMIQMKWL